MNLSKTGFALTVFFFVIFLAFTVLAVTFDVAETETGTVGFYSLNIGVRDTLGTSETWYKITTVLGLVAVAEASTTEPITAQTMNSSSAKVSDAPRSCFNFSISFRCMSLPSRLYVWIGGRRRLMHIAIQAEVYHETGKL